MSARTGLEHVDAKAGDKISGVFRRACRRKIAARFAIEQSREFVLEVEPGVERFYTHFAR
ncbi:hypothetical protein DXU07_07620 [Bradyrhizobium elkanii]|jgi:hypothetical protein|uniref:hypothetical protein n=1 Tax=Bradyrhizobium elkanii TaxID=29448 RepID=UPI00035C30BA|nr:hypothetical protein [Bradyrhizobium elkanii]NLS74152.1 hypothetical protein [Bradyrhizobium brasilense]QOZ15647.1 hypothetical protein XI02_12140 [Bradyrhizobium sp. CCBAU 21365]NWL43526.1 hypothetical protein [Bradyrhizobium elkanii]NWL73318.1 hypothetical protein [Bradyrhizobium elkanii]OIM94604.1 hypothetical protein BLN97_09840 [Bradyrhizobium elkanii]